ncbi:MAG TPA: hypothetical protein VF920_00650 [Dongiaceae bacterium]
MLSLLQGAIVARPQAVSRIDIARFCLLMPVCLALSACCQGNMLA